MKEGYIYGALLVLSLEDVVNSPNSKKEQLKDQRQLVWAVLKKWVIQNIQKQNPYKSEFVYKNLIEKIRINKCHVHILFSAPYFTHLLSTISPTQKIEAISNQVKE